ncbi:ATP-binding cassette domain-containing protein [Kribbella sp. NBC_01245]|uniref:ABC transporter ATP-binding protein n=1 Tax=Kribbella sp. NBC_01245 TaxID=2903578 RepID=UPI002E2A7396|nr:ATP-binding cassette domain-containing protein [Kribbella sp. NBC_01245]
MTGLAVTTHGLVHIYRSDGHDVAALSGIGIAIRPGELVGLLGPSGAGKSTLLQLCGGLIQPSAGRLRIGEHDVAKMSGPELDRMRASDVGIVIQGAGRNLVPYLTPEDNVRFAQRAAHAILPRRTRGAATEAADRTTGGTTDGTARGTAGRTAGGTAGRTAGGTAGRTAGGTAGDTAGGTASGRDLPAPRDVLALVGLADHARTPLGRLTPGQVQLAAVAVGIATFPGLLLADEPTSQLDHRARDEVVEAIRTVNAQTGMTVLLITHDPDVAAVLPRTITIRDGRIASEGRSGEEFAVVATDGSLPLPPHVADRLPPGTLLRVTITDGEVRLTPADDTEPTQ